MDSILGSTLILWTVRVSVAMYAAAVWRYLSIPRDERNADRVYRSLWAASWALCLIHVGCAFHFEHHWSHAAAMEHTAEMTERVIGIHWAGGLFINYLFLTLWGIDVLRPAAPTTRASIAMHAVAAFMMFNATAVFGPGWWWIPVAIFTLIGGMICLRNRASRPDSPEFRPKTG